MRRISKRVALSRYEKDEQGNIILDVSATRIEDLYNNFDKNAPYIRRDLDQELTDYLIECAREVERIPFTIRFTLDSPPDEKKSARIQRSMNTYFLYMAATEVREILHMFRRSIILFVIGLGILFASISLTKQLGPEQSVMADVLAEGLTIAGWVSLWESLVIFLVEWFPHRRNSTLYRRLADARLVFRAKSNL